MVETDTAIFVIYHVLPFQDCHFKYIIITTVLKKFKLFNFGAILANNIIFVGSVH